MSLLDDISAQATRKGPSCSVCVLISTLPTDDAAELELAINDPRLNYTGAAIARALSKRYDAKITAATFNRHLREHGHGPC